MLEAIILFCSVAAVALLVLPGERRRVARPVWPAGATKAAAGSVSSDPISAGGVVTGTLAGSADSGRISGRKVARGKASWGKAARAKASAGAGTEPAVLLDLTAALLKSGIGIEAALARLGDCADAAAPLKTVHRGLTAGMGWEASWEMIAEHRALQEFGEHLRFAHATGAPTEQMLRSAAKTLRSEKRHRAESAAQRLEVTMMLPLGLCFLPAFVLLGVVPVVVSMIPEVLGF